MLPYVPKSPQHNYNVPKVSQLRSFLSLLAWLSAGIVAVYVGLGFVVDIIAWHAPPAFEISLGKLILPKLKTPEKVRDTSKAS
jgi:hypothetical protein